MSWFGFKNMNFNDLLRRNESGGRIRKVGMKNLCFILLSFPFGRLTVANTSIFALRYARLSLKTRWRASVRLRIECESECLRERWIMCFINFLRYWCCSSIEIDIAFLAIEAWIPFSDLILIWLAFLFHAPFYHDLQTDKSCWTTVFTIAACVHLTGITFYGIFASGDLQPWAEPTLEEQKAWDPVATSTVKETSFVSLKVN